MSPIHQNTISCSSEAGDSEVRCRYARITPQQRGAGWSELTRLRKEKVGIGIYAWERCAEVLKTAIQERLWEAEAEGQIEDWGARIEGAVGVGHVLINPTNRFSYSRSNANTTNMTRFCGHNNFSTTTLEIKYFFNENIHLKLAKKMY